MQSTDKVCCVLDSRLPTVYVFMQCSRLRILAACIGVAEGLAVSVSSSQTIGRPRGHAQGSRDDRAKSQGASCRTSISFLQPFNLKARALWSSSTRSASPKSAPHRAFWPPPPGMCQRFRLSWKTCYNLLLSNVARGGCRERRRGNLVSGVLRKLASRLFCCGHP